MLFKTTLEIQSFIPVSTTFKIQEITPFIKQVERDYIIPVIGKELYDDLNEAYNESTPSLTPEQTKLLEKIRVPLSHFAFMLWIPFGQTQIDSSGIRIITTDNLKTAFQWQIKDLEGSANKSGFSGIEDLLAFLEDNKDDYDLWTSSDSYTEFKKHFIRSAKEFQKYFNINSSRRTYVAMFPIMNRIENTLFKRMLGTEKYDEIITQLIADDLTDANQEIVDLIRPSLASLTVSRAITELSVIIDEHGIGISNNQKEYKEIMQAKGELLSNLKNDALSDGNDFLKQLEELLNEDDEEYEAGPFENDPENGIGLF